MHTTPMIKPTRPANLADVSTWTQEQMAYAAPIIINKAVNAASETYAQAREAAAVGDSMGMAYAADLAKIANRYTKAVLFWQAVQLGENPKVPAFLKSQRVRSYEQMNKRVRPAKTRYAGNKDWGIWS